MRPLSDQNYRRQVRGLGQELVSDGTIPALNTDRHFLIGYTKNLRRTRDHMLEWGERSAKFHPEHHLFVGHVILHVGDIVYGDQFHEIRVPQMDVYLGKPLIDVSFAAEEDQILQILDLYQTETDLKGIFTAYETLRDKARLHDQVVIVEKHVGKIPTKTNHQKGLEDTMFQMAVSRADPGSSAKHYGDEVIRHTYLVGALIKRIQAAEQLRQRGLDKK